MWGCSVLPERELAKFHAEEKLHWILAFGYGTSVKVIC